VPSTAPQLVRTSDLAVLGRNYGQVTAEPAASLLPFRLRYRTMFLPSPGEPEIFTVQEVARAAGVAVADVRALLASGEVPSAAHRFVSFDGAVELVRALRAPADGRLVERRLFSQAPNMARPGGGPLAASGALHAGILAVMVLVTGLGLRSESTDRPLVEPVRLIFLATPGPGGGGGGGGLRMPAPPPKAQLKGAAVLRSPVIVTKKVELARREPDRRVETPPPPVPVPKPDPVPPPPPQPAPAPPVVAPVVSAPADSNDRAGVLNDSGATAASNGPGNGGGTGSGRGPGTGEGDGAGIGPGTIAGTGGGPYRPGSGISPPSLQREVKPIYTEEGRRRGVEGDVVMEVVVRADGTVGPIKILQGLGSGLDQRATDAVRQWRFSPARRSGGPVDVLVEVAVEFRLR
jgi:periplasmic protein TonB